TIPNSSFSSRISVSSGRSPGSTLPPGNSHNPAIALPVGRCANRMRPSTSTRAQATTRTSLTLTTQAPRPSQPGINAASTPVVNPALRTVITVDRDIFLGQVAGQHAVAAGSQAQRDPDGDFRLTHVGRH